VIPGTLEAVDAVVRESVSDVKARGRVRGSLRLLGPGFVAAIAYVDPGNFATNISGGAQFGYLLLWVILSANLMAVVVQYLSSKAGLVTGRSLPELCRDRYPRALRWFLWIQAEIVAIATDLAEFIGAAIAFSLLFGWPPLLSGVVTAVLALTLLSLQRRGFRPFELAIAAFLFVIVGGFGVSLALVHIVPADLLAGLVPRFAGTESALIAVGILGATVMPHVVYLHSALTSNRIQAATPDDVRHLIRHTRLDVVLAMLIAGAVNMSMLISAAAALHGLSGEPVETLAGAHAAIGTSIGGAAALAFAIALLASGLSSSSVGTMAGQVVMAGFIRRSIPLMTRRLITIAPSLVVLGANVEPTFVLILSQVVLSFGIPFALIPLIHMTASRSVMGEFVNRRVLTVVATVISTIVIGMNSYLIWAFLTGG
jgi:manganese transport protein